MIIHGNHGSSDSIMYYLVTYTHTPTWEYSTGRGYIFPVDRWINLISRLKIKKAISALIQ